MTELRGLRWKRARALETQLAWEVCRDHAGEEQQRGWLGSGLQGLIGRVGKQPVSDGQALQGSELRSDNT